MIYVSPVFSGEPDKKLHEKCLYPVVQIINSDNRGSCSGVILRSEKISNNKYHNVVVSTAHGMTLDKVSIKVPTYSNWSEISKTTVYPGLVYCNDASADLMATVFVSERKMYTADLGLNQKLYIGNKIIRVGCGLGDAPRLEEGFITGINMRNFNQGKVHRMSIYTLPGDSGGPVFEDYKIIGWTQSIRTNLENPFLKQHFYHYAMCIRIQDLYKLVETEKGGLDFIVDKSESLPVLAFFKLKTDYLNQNQRPIPLNPWIDK